MDHDNGWASPELRLMTLQCATSGGALLYHNNDIRGDATLMSQCCCDQLCEHCDPPLQSTYTVTLDIPLTEGCTECNAYSGGYTVTYSHGCTWSWISGTNRVLLSYGFTNWQVSWRFGGNCEGRFSGVGGTSCNPSGTYTGSAIVCTESNSVGIVVS